MKKGLNHEQSLLAGCPPIPTGNTWFRVFQANLIRNSDSPVNINELGETSYLTIRDIFDEAAGIESSDLTGEDIERLSPRAFELLAQLHQILQG